MREGKRLVHRVGALTPQRPVRTAVQGPAGGLKPDQVKQVSDLAHEKNRLQRRPGYLWVR